MLKYGRPFIWSSHDPTRLWTRMVAKQTNGGCALAMRRSETAPANAININMIIIILHARDVEIGEPVRMCVGLFVLLHLLAVDR